ncbi:DNA-binding transcriptional regulator, LysR family [Planctomicrobium piriforme]|uniref:DNA-binding transcriptional regulator, LysR family n=1 Tax=Planctomicrobium piriforme TaxID=1576369 RepID=A0A1I3DFW2_9PLAN|nr:DNA-binding transcriptional regulator, LysR family [Planctomicrobium piriforme]
MNLRNTEIFCDIATHRSFSKAAVARQISQPAVSQALQQLEDDIGVTLVDRSKRPIELTAAGTIYFERCQKWLLDYRAIEDAVHQFSGRVAGKVRVASIYSVGLLQMSSYVARIREDYPDIELHLDYAHPDAIYSRLLRDEVDLGIVSFPRDGGEIGSIPWQDQEMAVAVSPAHPLGARNQVSVKELDGLDFVAFSADLTIRRKTEKLLKMADVSVNVTHQFDNVETIKRAVEIDLGVAILPLPTLRRELEFGTLHAARFSDVKFVRPLGIVHKRHKHLSRAAEKFVEILHEDPGDGSPVQRQVAVGGLV